VDARAVLRLELGDVALSGGANGPHGGPALLEADRLCTRPALADRGFADVADGKPVAPVRCADAAQVLPDDRDEECAGQGDADAGVKR
jgi:hypothetical protein